VCYDTRHYTEAYNQMLNMFSSKVRNTIGDVLLVPDTHRWQEARILTDMLSFKASTAR
jgi:hypothetical protein